MAWFNGSIQSVRLAFTKAEEALEDAQHFRAEIDGGALPASTAEVINDLGNRLDALWVRLICAFSWFAGRNLIGLPSCTCALLRRKV
jgi:hypothetical protein